VNDMLGLSGDFSPRFLKKYAALDTVILDAVRSFASEVTDGVYPGTEHIFPAKDDR
jgi:3-methyl-2-oxobutanoate hydroxymethyltransferase